MDVNNLKGKHVLFLSYDGMTDPLGQSQVLPYLTGLAQKGVQYSLISFEKPHLFEKHQQIIKSICDAHQINWLPLMYTKTPPVLSTLYDIFKLNKKVKQLHQQKPIDLLHCRSYITALIGEGFKKKWGIPFLFDMRGFWADERVDGGIWPQSNPLFKRIYKFFKKKERAFLTEANHIISLTQNAKDEICSWDDISIDPDKISVIPCCVDLELFDPAKLDKQTLQTYKDKLGIEEGTPIIAYYGSIGTWYMLSEMMDCVRLWLHQQLEGKFLLVTPESPELILEMAIEKDIDVEKVLVERAVRNEMPYYIALCDFSLYFIRPAFSKKASSPTKQGEIMAMGKPVLCNAKVGDTDFVVHKYQSGILVEGFTNMHYQDALNQMQRRTFDDRAIRAGAIDFFSLDKGVASYQSVYEKILG